MNILLEVGDVVMVKKKKKKLDFLSQLFFSPDMTPFLGKEVTISSVIQRSRYNGYPRYTLLEGEESQHFTLEMFTKKSIQQAQMKRTLQENIDCKQKISELNQEVIVLKKEMEQYKVWYEELHKPKCGTSRKVVNLFENPVCPE